MAAPVILITGSTDGIGRATARELASRGAEVVIHGRDEEKCRKVLRELKESTGNSRSSSFCADFTGLENVRWLAEEISSLYGRLDVLINNAGTCEPARTITRDGCETTFQVNYLAPFLLTRLLLPLLRKSAPSRIVNVSSITHNFIRDIDWENLQGEKTYTLYGSYALTKFANITFTYTLAERIAGSGVTASCVNPGVISTKLLKKLFPSLIGMPASEGAKYLVFLALSPDVEGMSGEYFNAGEKPGRSSVLTYNPDIRKRLWQVAEELSGAW